MLMARWAGILDAPHQQEITRVAVLLEKIGARFQEQGIAALQFDIAHFLF